MKSEREAEHQRAKRHNYGKIAIACLPTFVSQDRLKEIAIELNNVTYAYPDGHVALPSPKKYRSHALPPETS
jgi:hypothetical protein